MSRRLSRTLLVVGSPHRNSAGTGESPVGMLRHPQSISEDYLCPLTRERMCTSRDVLRSSMGPSPCSSGGQQQNAHRRRRQQGRAAAARSAGKASVQRLPACTFETYSQNVVVPDRPCVSCLSRTRWRAHAAPSCGRPAMFELRPLIPNSLTERQ